MENKNSLKKEIKKYDYLFSKNKDYNSNPYHPRFEVAIDFIKKLNNIKTILDVGVGKGHLFKKLDNQKYTIEGIEPSKSAREILNDSRIKDAYSHKIPLRNQSFDLVVCLDVLEHIPSHLIEPSLKEINRISKKGAIISVAYHSDLVENMELHISSMPFKEWEKRIKKFFRVIEKKEVCSKKDSSKKSEVYLLEKK